MDAEGTDPDQQLARSPGAIWRRTLRGVLVSGGPDVEPMLITQPGDTIWDLLAIPRTRRDLVTELSDIYGVAEATIDVDLRLLLSDLLVMGLVIGIEESP
jgi:hypothetical protein